MTETPAPLSPPLISPPLISVVIPTRGRPALLGRAIASARAQTGVSFEIVVVDDGDGEGLEVIAGLGSADVRGLSSARQGQVAARRLGVKAAAGALIAFLDDDDWWADADHLAGLVAARGPSPALAYASGAVVVEDATLRVVETMPFVAAATAETLARDNTLIVSAILYDRALHDDLGEFDLSLPHYWDWDWYLRVARAGIPLRPSTGSAARISARHGSVSSDAHIGARRADLDRLALKHGLGHIPLRNHESIARDRLAAAESIVAPDACD
ncbi:MAG: glycosyltransferase family A protein [Ancalomicrobiaceae bacterium]|nr:glycosyltransferase family A protein [Ancalomicrobiaceae bacterium]